MMNTTRERRKKGILIILPLFAMLLTELTLLGAEDTKRPIEKPPEVKAEPSDKEKLELSQLSGQITNLQLQFVLRRESLEKKYKCTFDERLLCIANPPAEPEKQAKLTK